ncbi:MAG: GTP 3',8-cyclase MoaA [Nitrospinae bacterium]|nr:GTP 3',8-cyclase MoaA [Nitrospinota bacterium]
MHKAVDRWRRQISYLRISVTKRCNLKCAYCMPGDGGPIYPKGDILSIRQILRLAEAFAPMGIRKVRLTGGEPLMRKGIVALVDGLRAVGGIEEVAMTTNGVLLGRMMPALQAAGLSRVNVSLDTLRPERMRALAGHDFTEPVLNTIRAIAEKGEWPVKVNVVAIRGINDDEILDFARLAAELPVEVRFIEMMPTAHNRLWNGKTCLPSAEIERTIRERYELLPGPRGLSGGPAVVYGIAGGAGRVGFVSPLTKHFCGECNRMRLTAEGKLRACLFSDGEIDLKAGLDAGHEDDWFRQKFAEALGAKPERHALTPRSSAPCSRPMAAIGG